MKYDQECRDLLVRFLPTCGGIKTSMWLAAKKIQGSEVSDLVEVLGREWFEYPDTVALTEMMDTCAGIHGILDLEGVVRHFASYEHMHKFDEVKTDAASELPENQRQVAHTLLPLTLVAGKYFYECGEASVEIRGLIQLGATLGTPYTHLAGLIWIEDGGLSATILDEQSRNGVADRAVKLSLIDYSQAPELVAATKAAKEVLGL